MNFKHESLNEFGRIEIFEMEWNKNNENLSFVNQTKFLLF